MGTNPPPIPIRGGRLAITEKMIRDRLFKGGITSKGSADLEAMCGAVRALELQTPQLPQQAVALTAAFNAWRNGNHPGEVTVLRGSPEILAIIAFTDRFPAPRTPAVVPTATAQSTRNGIGVALRTVQNRLDNFTLTTEARLSNLRGNLAWFDNWVDSLNPGLLQTDNSFKGIYIEPEYYFTKPSPEGKREFLSLSEKQILEAQLKEISRAHPKILLVPGTIHYDVEMDSAQKVQAGYQLLQAAKNRLVRENALVEPGKILNRVMKHDETGPRSKVPSMNQLADTLLDKNTKPRMVHNVTYLLLNGTAVGTYDKHTDFYESKSMSPDLSMFIPGTQDECPEIGVGPLKFRFGVEICFDHGNGVLKRRGLADLDFHIVVSDSVSTKPGNMAMRNTGYFLHASTKHSESVIYRRYSTGQLANVEDNMRVGEFRLGAGFIQVFFIQLPAGA
jgi:hypothetical protein